MSASIHVQAHFAVVSFALALGVTIAHAEVPQVQEASRSAVAEVRVETRVQGSTPTYVLIGQETEHLLAMQRGAPAQRNRWIDGDQAGRSYARYLKSFEYPIPEKYESEDGFKK